MGTEIAPSMGLDLVEIEPRELRFPFELKKQRSCSIHLINKSNDYVAFKVKTTSPNRYGVRPNIGVILPMSSSEFTVTMQGQKTAPPDMQLKDKFLVQVTVVPFGTTEEDIIPEFFSEESGRYIEERKLRVILISPPSSPEHPLHHATNVLSLDDDPIKDEEDSRSNKGDGRTAEYLSPVDLQSIVSPVQQDDDPIEDKEDSRSNKGDGRTAEYFSPAGLQSTVSLVQQGSKFQNRPQSSYGIPSIPLSRVHRVSFTSTENAGKDTGDKADTPNMISRPRAVVSSIDGSTMANPTELADWELVKNNSHAAPKVNSRRERDWSLMSHDILLKILRKMPSPVDFLKFTITCKSWRQAAMQFKDVPSYPFLAEQYILYPSRALHLYSPFSKDQATINRPDLAGKRMAGHSEGYMLAVDRTDLTMSLINPVSHHQLSLPHLQHLPEGFQPHLVHKDKNLVIFSHVLNRHLVLGICKLGDQGWRTFSCRVGTGGGSSTYYQGKIFVNESVLGPTLIISPANCKVVRKIPGPQKRTVTDLKAFGYLVVSPHGLLRVLQSYDTKKDLQFEVHMLREASGIAFWRKVETLDSLMLFLDKHTGFCLGCSDTVYGRLRGNTIYYTKMNIHGCSSWSGSLCRYDLGSGLTEVLPHNLKSKCTWLIPSTV